MGWWGCQLWSKQPRILQMKYEMQPPFIKEVAISLGKPILLDSDDYTRTSYVLKNPARSGWRINCISIDAENGILQPNSQCLAKDLEKGSGKWKIWYRGEMK